MGNMRRIKKTMMAHKPVKSFRRTLSPGECEIKAVVTAKSK